MQLLFAAWILACAQDPAYVVLEGGGPDQGPGKDVGRNFAQVLETFGPADPAAARMIAVGVQQLRLLSRSAAVVAADVARALDAAERTGVPVWLHVDPMYAWGADSETKPEDAPSVKFWEHPEMREWGEWPVDGALPTHIPRLWFNWGPWCTSAPAVPALGSPTFVAFARGQLADGVLAPLAERLAKWRGEGKSHLFAGINIGWETHFPAYPKEWGKGGPIEAAYPRSAKGLKMDPRIPGLRTGYASLHWRGWDEAKLLETAKREGVSRDERFRRLCYEAIHGCMEALAEECVKRGLSPDRVYTHIVALATLKAPDTNHPPIWTAVNRHSLPGFTMDNQGAAKYDLAKLVEAVKAAPGSRGGGFGAVESYVSLAGRVYVTDADAYVKELDELFAAGARVKAIYSAFPLDGGRTPEAALVALRRWRDRR